MVISSLFFYEIVFQPSIPEKKNTFYHETTKKIMNIFVFFRFRVFVIVFIFLTQSAQILQLRD